MTKDEAIKVLNMVEAHGLADEAKRMAIESLSADPKWITDSKPTENGTYMVTVEGIVRDRIICLMHYGKPLMPNCKVRGKCWYDSDSEYGDIVYDDDEILAWLPLPKPYDERRNHD